MFLNVDPLAKITEKKDGFLFFNNHIDKYSIYKQSLLIDGSKITETIRYINKNNVKSISINSSYFDNIKDLHFLNEIRDIECISILDDNYDLSILNLMYNLKQLSFGQSKQEIDLSNFKDLKIFGCDFSNKIKNLDKCLSLEWVWLRNYKNENLIEFSNLINLKFLHIYNTKIKDIEGIGNLKELEDFEIEKALQLHSLQGITSNNSKIVRFCIDNAKSLNDVNDLFRLNNLEELFLIKIGEIDNVDFINNMNNLMKFGLGGKVKNINNMEMLKKIKTVYGLNIK